MNIFNKIIDSGYNNRRIGVKWFAETILGLVLLIGCDTIDIYSSSQSGTLPERDSSYEAQELVEGGAVIDQPLYGSFSLADELSINIVSDFVEITLPVPPDIEPVPYNEGEHGREDGKSGGLWNLLKDYYNTHEAEICLGIIFGLIIGMIV
ncbi:MAG: hypothetical protein PHY29_08565 [Syntrophales bacterium]|nr:hypothetical protein [Syntrophales bacterium]